jgi:hypothetical protein
MEDNVSILRNKCPDFAARGTDSTDALIEGHLVEVDALNGEVNPSTVFGYHRLLLQPYISWVIWMQGVPHAPFAGVDDNYDLPKSP